MCQAITDRYAEEGLPIDLIPTQLKEKFATLRFYYSFEGTQYGSAAIDFLGSRSIRFGTTDDTPLDDRMEKLHRDIAQIIRTYEAKSKTVCEKCGSTDSAIIEPQDTVTPEKILADTDELLSEFSADYKRVAE